MFSWNVFFLFMKWGSDPYPPVRRGMHMCALEICDVFWEDVMCSWNIRYAFGISDMFLEQLSAPGTSRIRVAGISLPGS